MPTTPTRAGELRMLREIQYKVLNEMVERLRPS
jgi:serine/threonine-protein kinase HipA